MELLKIPNKWVPFMIVAAMTIFGVCCASDQYGVLKQTLFTRINVPSTVLQKAGTMEEFPTISPVVCAQQAKRRQSYHLAYFSNDGICSLYNLPLPSNYEAMDYHPNITTADLNECYTDLPKGCLFDSQFFLEGTTRTDSGCINVTCANRTWIPTHGEFQDCPYDGYVSVPGSGCIMVIEEWKMFEDAKEFCETKKARLVIPNNFEALRQYVQCNHKADADYRVGIRNDQWMDGRIVDADSWYTGLPYENVYNCGSMWTPSNDRKLYDEYCHNFRYFICQYV